MKVAPWLFYTCEHSWIQAVGVFKAPAQEGLIAARDTFSCIPVWASRRQSFSHSESSSIGIHATGAECLRSIRQLMRPEESLMHRRTEKAVVMWNSIVFTPALMCSWIDLWGLFFAMFMRACVCECGLTFTTYWVPKSSTSKVGHICLMEPFCWAPQLKMTVWGLRYGLGGCSGFMWRSVS